MLLKLGLILEDLHSDIMKFVPGNNINYFWLMLLDTILIFKIGLRSSELFTPLTFYKFI
jgi:hypothetical protein